MCVSAGGALAGKELAAHHQRPKQTVRALLPATCAAQHVCLAHARPGRIAHAATVGSAPVPPFREALRPGLHQRMSRRCVDASNRQLVIGAHATTSDRRIAVTVDGRAVNIGNGGTYGGSTIEQVSATKKGKTVRGWAIALPGGGAVARGTWR